MLELVQGMKLGRGAVMIPAGAFRRMEELLSVNKVEYRRLAVGYLFSDAG